MKVIGTHGGLAVDNQTPEILLKSVAFLGGPACLDACLPYLRNGGQQLALRTATDEIPVHDPLAERLDLLLRAQSMPADGKTSASLVRAAADLISDFPEYRPPQRWAGVFAQIVSPFEGEITSSAGELQAEESADRQAA